MRRFCAAGVVTLLFAVPASAANEHGSLAIHLVASNEYLQCEDLCPPGMTCEDIDCDLSMAELEASGSYGYVVFVAYNVDQILAIEFLVVGWPSGPGTPGFDGPWLCTGEGGGVVGQPFECRGGSGGLVAFPSCREPCSGMVGLCYVRFGPSVHDWLPITLGYAPSEFSNPDDPGNWFGGCSPDWEMTLVSYEHPAVIGGTCDPIPNCEPGPTGTDGSTWGAVKSLYR